MSKIRAISLWEPWASLIAVKAKKWETRSWGTEFRGELLICAAQTQKGIKIAEETGLITGSAAYSGRELCVDIDDEEIELNFGNAVAIVELTDCITTKEWRLNLYNDRYSDNTSKEIGLGDYTPGRFAWKLENIRRIKEPYPVKGKQGFFFVEMPEGVEFV
jgi:hypothetical protein